MPKRSIKQQRISFAFSFHNMFALTYQNVIFVWNLLFCFFYYQEKWYKKTWTHMTWQSMCKNVQYCHVKRLHFIRKAELMILLVFFIPIGKCTSGGINWMKDHTFSTFLFFIYSIVCFVFFRLISHYWKIARKEH